MLPLISAQQGGTTGRAASALNAIYVAASGMSQTTREPHTEPNRSRHGHRLNQMISNEQKLVCCNIMYLDIIEVYEAPAIEMCPDSDVHVLNSGPVEPAPGVLQRLDPPHPSRPIEPEEVQERAIHLLLHLKMEAQVDVLQPSQQVLVLVHKRPTRLHQPYLRLPLHQNNSITDSTHDHHPTIYILYLKMWDCELEEIRGRLEIRIKNRNELIILHIVTAHGRVEIPGFVAGPNNAMAIDNVDATLPPPRDLILDHALDHLIVGIIKNLNQKSIFRPIQLTHRRNRHLIHLINIKTQQKISFFPLLSKFLNYEAKNLITSRSLHIGICTRTMG